MTSDDHNMRTRRRNGARGGRTGVLPRILKAALGAAAAAAFFITALLTSTELVIYGIPGYFSHELKKYDVYADLPVKEADVNRVMNETMEFLRGNRDSLADVTAEIDGVREAAFYNDSEVSHMADVKEMFTKGFKLRNAAALCSLLCLCSLKAFAIAGTLIMTACAVAVICAVSDFTRFFTMFHEIFFPQGNWEFDPAQSRMINMLPEGLFSDTAMYIAIIFTVMEVTAIAAAWYVAGRKRRERKEIKAVSQR